MKVSDLIRFFGICEKLFDKPLGMNPSLVDFLVKLRTVLEPAKSLTQDEFLVLLDSTFRNSALKKLQTKETLKGMDVENISLEAVKKLVTDESLSKEELLYLGEKRFGISKGTHQKTSKEKLRELVLSTIQNIETMKIIEEKASS